MTGKHGLSRRRREPRSDREVAQAACRMVKALGQRAATADPNSAELLNLVQAELDEAWATAVAGWRNTGFSDREIGDQLEVTKQAIQQRWPRPTQTEV